MIKSMYSDKTITPNQRAKQLVVDAIEARACDYTDVLEGMTEREQEAFKIAFDRQFDRVIDLMGRKIFRI